MTIPMQTDEELNWIKDYVLYSVVMDVLERDIAALKETKLKMSEVYIRALRKAQNIATKQHSLVRQELKKRGIKVYDVQRVKEQFESSYLVRGYHASMNMLWGTVKVEVSERIYKYMDIDPTDDALAL